MQSGHQLREEQRRAAAAYESRVWGAADYSRLNANQQAEYYALMVSRCMLKPDDARFETAWCQPLQLLYDKLPSTFTFKDCDLRRYSMAFRRQNVAAGRPAELGAILQPANDKLGIPAIRHTPVVHNPRKLANATQVLARYAATKGGSFEVALAGLRAECNACHKTPWA